jgi:hypothetical protein
MKKNNSIAQPVCMNRSRFLHMVAMVGFMFSCWGCSGMKEEEDIKPQSDEFVTCTINGKTLTGPDPLVLYSDYDSGSIEVSAVLEINATEGYLLSFGMDAPKVGTFTTKASEVTGEVSYIAGTLISPTIKEYELTSSAQNTVTFTKFDPQGFAEGEFSLTAKAKDGKTLSLTNGKFRIKL